MREVPFDNSGIIPLIVMLFAFFSFLYVRRERRKEKSKASS